MGALAAGWGLQWRGIATSLGDSRWERADGYIQTYAYGDAEGGRIGNLTSKGGVSYDYNQASKPHAVTAIGGTDTYEYDGNGNLLKKRVSGNVVRDITWDEENRPVTIVQGANTSSFVYDGDGNRVKKTEGGQTILYVNQYYEKNLTAGDVTTYYYLGGKMVAKCTAGTLTYIHQDSVNSTSVVTNTSGSSVGTFKAYPFGGTWSSSGTLPAQKFTGQRLDDTGLYFYNARYYDAAIGRFISPDTVVLDPANPQSLNRYSYCLNNPLKYVDPSGHLYIDTNGDGIPDEDMPVRTVEPQGSGTGYIDPRTTVIPFSVTVTLYQNPQVAAPRQMPAPSGWGWLAVVEWAVNAAKPAELPLKEATFSGSVALVYQGDDITISVSVGARGDGITLDGADFSGYKVPSARELLFRKPPSGFEDAFKKRQPAFQAWDPPTRPMPLSETRQGSYNGAITVHRGTIPLSVDLSFVSHYVPLTPGITWLDRNSFGIDLRKR